MPKSSARALALIHRFEGIDVPWRWPGKASGVTLPYGYDLGYERNFERDWGALLPEVTMDRLRPVLGLKGEAAHRAALKLRDVKISLAAAEDVFNATVLPREEALTARVFPGSDTLPGDAFGALVSLVYNRGALIDQSDRRREMLELYRLFRKGLPFDVIRIADLVESQKRLWADVRTSDGDLHDRRIAEAALIRGANRQAP